MKPTLRYSPTSNLFGLFSASSVQKQARRRGFEWDPRGFFKTASPFKALLFLKYADDTVRQQLRPFIQNVIESQATDSILEIPCPAGLAYMPFQKAGIAYASRRMNTLIGDDPGTGKSIEAIGLANYLGIERLLVVCPAGLRLNWEREIDKWHLHNPGVDVLLDGKSGLTPFRSTVVSYDLAVRLRSDLMRRRYGMVILDEGHYLKNVRAHRTKMALGRGITPGLISLAPRRLVLTGTPIPNRVDEAYSVIRALAPATIDGMSYRSFLAYYAVVKSNGFGEKVVGIRHEEELYQRLRAGFMVRRLKKDVLKDLPDKRYKMVIFDKSGFNSVLNRERQFSAAEILSRGVPVGSALPEIRHEMGVAKAPLVSKYVEDLLEDGTQAVIVFAHHKAVIEILARNLQAYSPLTITGATSNKDRQSAIDGFQKGDSRVIICNLIAGGVGVTLTKAADVVFAETSWVPGENEQCEDRAHRVGQMKGVLIHHLVVEGGLDAAILGAAAMKRRDIQTILDGEKS